MDFVLIVVLPPYTDVIHVHPPFIKELSESDIINGTMMILLAGAFFLENGNPI
ncbi:hypothetical protein HNR77_000279 [Paenibacillus sp. JGP012]|nr:hypothetical protein [Paenibacillus sp. JGP012]